MAVLPAARRRGADKREKRRKDVSRCYPLLVDKLDVPQTCQGFPEMQKKKMHPCPTGVPSIHLDGTEEGKSSEGRKMRTAFGVEMGCSKPSLYFPGKQPDVEAAGWPVLE